MPSENGMVTTPRRGRAITVRTPGRPSFADATTRPMLEEPAAEPSEDDLIDLDELEELEEGDAPPPPDEGEELEMWMRQTRRAHLLTPGQEEELAKRVQAKDLVDSGKFVEALKLLKRDHVNYTDFDIEIMRREEVQRPGHPAC
jgi:Sigma-70 factor, region 1.2